MSQNDSPTGKSSSELRVCVLRCVRDVRASDVERSKRVCECVSVCESEWESERESKRESAVAKANLRKILRSALRPASRGSLCPRCVVWSRLISMLISIMVVNASSPPPPISLSHAVWFYRYSSLLLSMPHENCAICTTTNFGEIVVHTADDTVSASTLRTVHVV